MIGEGPSVYQTAYGVVRRELRAGLLDAADRWHGPGGFGSEAYRATAALYALLLEHSVDRRGFCCSCRRPGAMVGRRRRPCRIYPLAQHWLHQRRTARLVSELFTELGLSVAPAPVPGSGPDRPGLTVTERQSERAADRDDTDDLSRTVPGLFDHGSQLAQSPAASFPPPLPDGGLPPAGRPDPDHGGTGEHPGLPRSRRGPSDDPEPPPGHGRALLLTGGAACPA